MKKITRCTLDELAKRLPVIDEDEMRLYVGGGTGTPGDPYTEDELNAMLDSGIWKGGYVDGFEGYVLPEISVAAPGSTSGNVSYYDDSSTLDNPTFSDVVRIAVGSSQLGGALEKLFPNDNTTIRSILSGSNYGAGMSFWVEKHQNGTIRVYNKEAYLIGEYSVIDNCVHTYIDYESSVSKT